YTFHQCCDFLYPGKSFTCHSRKCSCRTDNSYHGHLPQRLEELIQRPQRYTFNSSSSTFASLRSSVSNPSVNHPYTGASSSRASSTLHWSRQRRARLMAARSSQDFACCWRATASARSKYVSAFAASGSGDMSVTSPAMRLASASNGRSV